LLSTHEALAQCILNDPEASTVGLSQRIAEELESLKELRDQNAAVIKAYETLSLDHQFVDQRLRDREMHLRELASVIPAAVYSCDAEGQIIYYNRQAVELWGREPLLNEPSWSFLEGRIYRPNSNTAICG
jgi:PAS domain-containing protein